MRTFSQLFIISDSSEFPSSFQLKMSQRKRSGCTSSVPQLASILLLTTCVKIRSEIVAFSLPKHFAALIATNAHEKPSTDVIPLPAGASSEVLHFDDTLFIGAYNSHERETRFTAALAHETALRAVALPGSVFPYVLCGPQSASPDARAALKNYTGADRHPVS